jgi:transcriptional regulator with XRE-family HTH domain
MAKQSSVVDQEVGARVRLRRKELGLSQQKLGTAVGVTFQQIQKYENGQNRIGAGRLHAIGQELGVPISYFFDELLGSDEETIDPVSTAGLLRTSGALDLLRNYARIEAPELRRMVQNVARTLAR